jgi:protein AroM
MPEFVKIMGYAPRIVERGLLDGLGSEEIKALRPSRPTSKTLVSRLRNGAEVKLSEQRIRKLMPLAIRDLAQQDEIDAIVLFCTGEFPRVDAKIPILYPSSIVKSVVSSILFSKKRASRRIGIIAPVPEQFGMLNQKWRSIAGTVALDALSPYTASEDEIRNCGKRFSELDLVVLDCMGYMGQTKAKLAEQIHAPILLPRSILARVTAEILA